VLQSLAMSHRGTAAFAACTALLGCHAGSEPLHQRRDPGALVVAEAADILALDLARVVDTESIEVGEQIFEGLVGWTAGTTEIAPRLATAWDVSPDGRTWTFHLRGGVLFHDGTPMDAGAVVASFERLLDPKHPNYLPQEEGTEYWRGMLKVIDRVVATDPSTVEIRTERPYAPLIADLVGFPIVSPTAVAHWGDRFALHPVGTGPYMFEAWQPGADVTLRRFDHYWGGTPALERIVFEVVIDARQRLVELESGSVDLANSILPDEQPFVELHPDLVLHHAPGNDVSYLAFNTQHPPFDDVRVRRAASYAINKEPIVQLGYEGRAIAADGPLPPTMWAAHEPKQRYPYDPDEAKRLLAAAAADGSFDASKTYHLYAPSTPRGYLPEPERVARFLQTALEQVGIHTDLELLPYTQDRDAIEAGKHDLCLFGWIGDTGDPDNFLYVLFHSDNTLGAAQNVAYYRDSAVDRVLLEAQSTADPAKRSALYGVVQDQISIDAPWVPLAHSELILAGRAEVEGVVLSPTGTPLYPAMHRAEPP
jgi:peptide/nickel transport system substrate-binding protein